MEQSHDSAAPGAIVPARMLAWSNGAILAAITGLALAIRVYLSVTSYCISGDGVSYVLMARDFADGRTARALESVFPPLYPYLIMLAHRAIGDWELAGDLVSSVLGALTCIAVFHLVREQLGRRDLAIGASVLAAIHPGLADYSASVRTEAGYIFFAITAAALILSGIRRRRLGAIAIAGAVSGIAYTYRSEAIAMPVFVAGFMIAGAVLWRRWTLGWGAAAAATFVALFLVTGGPYLALLNLGSAHFVFSREFKAAVLFGMGDVTRNKELWHTLAYRGDATIFTPFAIAPSLVLRKFARELVLSPYYFVAAMGVLLSAILAWGIAVRGRAILSRWADGFLVLLILFYTAGFAISYPGPRFMLHLVPFTLGWLMLGLDDLARRVGESALGARVPAGALAGLVAIVLLPQTLTPIGRDLSAYRYAGEEIARTTPGARAVVANDERTAFYADARWVLTPDQPPKPDWCGWLEARGDGVYLMVSDKDATRLGIADDLPCLRLIKRYARDRTRHFDLYKVTSGK
jgi:Dolichyl-phosphate-mannose-protein mannosyltransferase